MIITIDLFDMVVGCIFGAMLLLCGIIIVIERIKQRRKNRK